MVQSDKASVFDLNQTIISVERAAGDLRRALPVMVKSKQGTLLMMSAEFISDQRLSEFKQIGSAEVPAEILIGLTYERANILKIPPRSGGAALVKLSDHMSSAVIQSMANPVDDLKMPLKGPFTVSDVPCNAAYEAGLKLCKIARLLPAAVFVTLSDDHLAALGNDILSVQADNIKAFDLTASNELKIVTAAKVPLQGAENTRIIAFRPDDGGTEHFAIVIGDPCRSAPVLCRIHSECFTGDLLGSLKCDCGDQMRGAIKFMAERGSGILLYLAQEGRGIGLINKMRAYELQDQGFDTVDANERLGFQSDERIFAPAAEMLKLMGYSSVDLLTNNPNKVMGLENCGITVNSRVEHKFPSNSHNEHYLQTKKKRSGHLL